MSSCHSKQIGGLPAQTKPATLPLFQWRDSEASPDEAITKKKRSTGRFMTASPERRKLVTYKPTEKDPEQLALLPRDQDPATPEEISDFLNSISI